MGFSGVVHTQVKDNKWRKSVLSFHLEGFRDGRCRLWQQVLLPVGQTHEPVSYFLSKPWNMSFHFMARGVSDEEKNIAGLARPPLNVSG